MATIDVNCTTEELHKIEMSMTYVSQHMPDQTVEEKKLFKVIIDKFNRAYINADWIDFQNSHKDGK